VHGLNNVKGLEFEVVFMVGTDTLAPHPGGSERSIRAPDLYTAATRARQKLVLTGTRFQSSTDNHTGLNVLTVAEQLSHRLASQDFEEERLRRLMKLTEDE
jgi:superfamily I DNA/RNA helicase